MYEILFKRLSPKACPPVRMHDGDAGWDVCAIGYEPGLGNGVYVYHTGLAFAVPKGMWLDVRARSSVYKTGLMLCNGVGTVDSGYRGEVRGMFYAIRPGLGEELHPYVDGDRVLQLIPMPCRCDEVLFKEVDELPPSADGRDEGGFGSTDNLACFQG